MYRSVIDMRSSLSESVVDDLLNSVYGLKGVTYSGVKKEVTDNLIVFEVRFRMREVHGSLFGLVIWRLIETLEEIVMWVNAGLASHGRSVFEIHVHGWVWSDIIKLMSGPIY